jgi:hypothetical protein
MKPNYRLINALLALHEMQDTKGYGFENATAEMFQRCARWLDAMVPPECEEERPTEWHHPDLGAP